MPYYSDSDSDDYSYGCDWCGTRFRSRYALIQHWTQSPQHHYCQYCDKHYPNAGALENHRESDHFYCSSCEKVFESEHGLHSHYRQSPKHDWCDLCKRLFQNANNLKTHMRCVHGPKNVKCVSDHCDKKFISRSAMIKHLEMGKCPSGIDRYDVHKCVRRTDDDQLIMKAPISVAEDSWNGHAFECPLCDKEFDYAKSLASHLISPKHKDEIRLYSCPGWDCDLRFRLFSAFVEHVDSKKCDALSDHSLWNAIMRVLEQLAEDFSPDYAY
ncbi:hypothetical protein CPC08DRAFT_735496 [Agrocybe pediades]|nr:hypothetical protein CPC08DRAFT_735496 [Agrocybe pediades]